MAGARRHGRPARCADASARIVAVITPLLAKRHLSIQVVAARLGTSTRTLQRRLATEGLNYVDLVARARANVARTQLADTTTKIADVARLVGYSDPGHFTRAFVRWTGVTPRQYRARLRPQSSVSQGAADVRSGRRGARDPSSA